jgi:hypothetical protein
MGAETHPSWLDAKFRPQRELARLGWVGAFGRRSGGDRRLRRWREITKAGGRRGSIAAAGPQARLGDRRADPARTLRGAGSAAPQRRNRLTAPRRRGQAQAEI